MSDFFVRLNETVSNELIYSYEKDSGKTNQELFGKFCGVRSFFESGNGQNVFADILFVEAIKATFDVSLEENFYDVLIVSYERKVRSESFFAENFEAVRYVCLFELIVYAIDKNVLNGVIVSVKRGTSDVSLFAQQFDGDFLVRMIFQKIKKSISDFSSGFNDSRIHNILLAYSKIYQGSPPLSDCKNFNIYT